MSRLTSGQVARRGGVNLESIRFYEREGLLPKPPRRANGYRAFTEDDVRRVCFIKRAQELGFSLKEIAELLALRSHSDSTCSQVRSHAEAKIADIDGKISELRKIRKELLRLSKACHGARKPSCPILEKLETDGV
ncbi:MAG TPA: heavy metal-responsive transcriptional regulator [Tepidisphaeraceae bacterium]|jgi:Cu(I)-responsive transcriptional regulator|nr:heavy metal-responsive transcriptional regulator [Tepidisphaeraceae bacterium]